MLNNYPLTESNEHPIGKSTKARTSMCTEELRLYSLSPETTSFSYIFPPERYLQLWLQVPAFMWELIKLLWKQLHKSYVPLKQTVYFCLLFLTAIDISK